MSPEPEPWRPRATDHLVEPMYAGLGLEDDAAAEPSDPADEPGRSGILRRLLRLLGLAG